MNMRVSKKRIRNKKIYKKDKNMFKWSFNKKIAIVLIFTVIFVSYVPFYAIAVENTGKSNFSILKGDIKVLAAQKWLNETYTGKFTYTPVEEDGIIGSATIKALIIALQIELGIGNNSSGFFGPATASMCPEISKSNPGNNSNIIKILQHGLFCKGCAAYDSYGTFGEFTEMAVKKVESDAGLEPRGIATPIIFKAILNMDNLRLNFYRGDSNIRFIQQTLNKKYNKYFGIMPTDGIYCASTNKALIYALQAEEGLSTSVANGNFGNMTKSLCPTLTYGDARSNFVTLLQFVLYCNGFDPKTFDGIYGDTVKSKVIEFQDFMCLKVSGDADKETQMSLYTSCGDTTRFSSACDTATRLNEETVKTIKTEGCTHVGRYLTNAETGTLDKKMTNEEIQIILKEGLSIFPIYQTYGASANYYTIERAKEDAVRAENAAKNFDFPKETTLYFAVDYDANDFQVKNVIIPYFEQLNKSMKNLGVSYNIGIYGPRNVCSRVYDEGYSKYCFVSDASSGYSGNLGYCMPKQWSFDQFKTDVYIGSGAGRIAIDKTAYSGLDKAVSRLDKDLAEVNEAYLMLEYLRHSQSLLTLLKINPDNVKCKFEVQTVCREKHW